MATDSMRIPLARLLVADADAAAGMPVSPDADRAHWLRRVRAWTRALQSLQGRDVALACEDGLEFARSVEVVLERGLVASRHHEHIGESRLDGLFDDVLDGRLVDDGEHLFRHRLRRREEPRS